jgi:hypothetical protein
LFHNRIGALAFSRIEYLFLLFRPNRKKKFQELIHSFGSLAYRSGRDDQALIKDMLYSKHFYAIRDLDYFHFGLDQEKGPEKLEYVGWEELKHYYTVLAQNGRQELFDRKDKTYEIFRPFFHRELYLISGKTEEKQFFEFFEQKRSGIIKPFNTFGGNGIQILSLSEEQSPEHLWDKVAEHCPFVLEELIVQAPEMNAFYPNAINTIRYTTFFHDGKLTKLQATLRMGRGGRQVDNITQGGIFAPVDLETGRITGPARSFLCEQFDLHPDTGIQFEGNFIPQWDALKKLVEEVACIVPEQKLVGWDFAFSKDGWVMVEANWNPGLQSFDPNHGLRGLITDTIGKVIKMWQ